MGRLYRKSLKNPFITLIIMFAVLTIILMVLLINYNNGLKEARRSLIGQEEFFALLPENNVEEFKEVEEASADLNKGINEVIEETVAQEQEQENDNTVSTNVSETQIQEPVKKELNFEFPVDGEIVKDFARESLIYSDTLKEWTIHNGIDIKAERTTVVKAAEDGKVIAIKNDPRFGLTVIIEHQDGFKTIYSNLLTSEFIKEGEELGKGQSIGTVGNSAPFEIADEAHLHFEMMQNNEYVDPKIYLK